MPLPEAPCSLSNLEELIEQRRVCEGFVEIFEVRIDSVKGLSRHFRSTQLPKQRKGDTLNTLDTCKGPSDNTDGPLYFRLLDSLTSPLAFCGSSKSAKTTQQRKDAGGLRNWCQQKTCVIIIDAKRSKSYNLS
jgi:hypothetical protein